MKNRRYEFKYLDSKYNVIIECPTLIQAFEAFEGLVPKNKRKYYKLTNTSIMRKKMYIAFDCETTGLPKSYNGAWSDLKNWPRLTQFGFILFDETGKVYEEYQSMIKPDGWVVPKEQFFIENNMSTERCEKEGRPIAIVLRQFQEALKQADLKIAHNINFDNPIVGSEMIRAGITHELFQFKRGICTMRSTTNICCLPKARGYGYKWPKLIELHNFLFGCDFEGAHDALDDVKATVNCFIELKNRNIISA